MDSDTCMQHRNPPNPICPACLSTYSKLYCAKCVLRGSITSDKSNGETYCDKMRRLEMAKSRSQKVLSEIKQLEASKQRQRLNESLILEKKANIADLRRAIIAKREEISLKGMELKRLSYEGSNLKQRSFDAQNKQRGLKDSSVLLEKNRHKYWHEASTLEDRVALLRESLCVDLMRNVFPIQLSTDPDVMDKICDVALCANKEDISTGPEPNISSQASLQYIVVATRTLACLLDVWLPAAAKRSLSLGRMFGSSQLILRDDLARVHQSVARCVRLLCASQHLPEPIPVNPLAGLGALSCAKGLGRKQGYEMGAWEIFDKGLTGELETVDESWNSPLSGASAQDWVEVSTDIPFDAAILAYEQESAVNGASGGVGTSSIIQSTFASMWRWTTWSTTADHS